MKKVFAILLTAGLFLLLATPGLATTCDGGCPNGPENGFDGGFELCECIGFLCEDCRNVNEAYIDNTVMSTAKTGGNMQNNYAESWDECGAEIEDEGQRTLVTGDAYADARAMVEANTGDACPGMDFCMQEDDDLTVSFSLPLLETNFADVYNTVMASANTGDNHQNNTAIGGSVEIEDEGSRMLGTGAASAVSSAWTLVNSSMDMD